MFEPIGTAWNTCVPTLENRYYQGMRFSLLFVDLDGTLVGHEGIPSPRTVSALRAAKAAGCAVMVCTGRHRYMVEPIEALWAEAAELSPHLELSGAYGAYSNGSVLVDLSNGRTVHKMGLTAAVVRRAAEIAHSQQLAPLLSGIHVHTDGGFTTYTDRTFDVHLPYKRRNEHRLRFVDSIYSAAELSAGVTADQPSIRLDRDDTVTDIGVYGPREAVRATAELWREHLGKTVVVYETFDQQYDSHCAFLNNSVADKVLAAKIVADLLGVPRERTLAIGDHLNDVELLKWAGMGVCMGDGHETARACADHITGTLADDGAAQAIERFVLGWK